jgi:hypothetical protein
MTLVPALRRVWLARRRLAARAPTTGAAQQPSSALPSPTADGPADKPRLRDWIGVLAMVTGFAMAVPVGAALDHRPRADAARHSCPPSNIERNMKPINPARKKTMDQQVGTILNEADIYGPRTGHTDLDLCSAGTDVNDDYSRPTPPGAKIEPVL